MQPVSRDIGALTEAIPNVPIIVIGDRDDSHHVGEALRRGIRGYIPACTLTSQILMEVLRLVQAGGTFVPAGALAELSYEQVPRDALDSLTPRQRQVLNLLREGKPNKIIAYELAMRESTVKVHVRQIMRKLQASNRTEATFLASNLKTLASGAVPPHLPAGENPRMAKIAEQSEKVPVKRSEKDSVPIKEAWELLARFRADMEKMFEDFFSSIPFSVGRHRSKMEPEEGAAKSHEDLSLDDRASFDDFAEDVFDDLIIKADRAIDRLDRSIDHISRVRAHIAKLKELQEEVDKSVS